MSNNPVCRLREALGIAGSQQGVQQNVIGLERGIGFEFAAPVAVRVLLREKKFPRRRNGSPDVAGEFFDFSEAKLRVRT